MRLFILTGSMSLSLRRRGLLGIAVVLWGASASVADVTIVEGEGDNDGLRTFQMTVTLAPEPVPALKHRMWMRPHELKPGNAATHYLRSYAENHLGGTWRGVRKKFGDEVDSWYRLDIPIKQLPLEKVRQAASQFDSIVEQFIRPGTQCRDTDWGLEPMDLRGPATITFLLPGFQQSRSIARMLALRTRLAIAEGRYDDAMEHLRMNYRLGQDVGQEMFLVCNLIGMAIEGIANTAVIDLIAAPDSPNLYWALSEVPAPLVDCREAVRLEMTLGTRIFPVLMNVETTEHSPEEWARLVGEGIKVFQEFGGISQFPDFGAKTGMEPVDRVLRGFIGMDVSMVEYPAAKQRLIQSGLNAERIEKMPVGKVVLMDAAREYRRIADEYEKWWYVPYPESRVRMRQSRRLLAKDDGSPFSVGRAIANFLLPALQAVRTAQARMEWQKNAFLVIEALRMHAAKTGSFPVSLDEIRVVPVPLNPITTRPYLYRLDGKTAVLELPFSDGMPGVAWRFEIQLADDLDPNSVK